jgi:predicted MFS family arabinose efflux permease
MWLALAAGALNLGGAGIGSLYMINAYEVLGLTPTEMSATVVVYSLSAIVGVSTARSITRRLGLVRSVALLAPTAASALFLVCAAKLVLPLASLVVYEMVFGYCATVWVVSATTLQQRILPTERLGRVVGLTRTVSALAIPIGALGAGALAEAWHLQATLLTCASLATVTTAFAALRIFIGGFRDGGDRALTAHAGHA